MSKIIMFLFLIFMSLIYTPFLLSLDIANPEDIISFAYSHNDNYIATVLAGDLINIYNTYTQNIEKTFINPTNRTIWKVEFSPDDNYLAFSSGNEIMIYEMASEEIVLRIISPDYVIQTFSYRPDGQKIVTVSTLGIIRIWDIASGNEIMTITENISIFINEVITYEEMRITVNYPRYYVRNVSYSPCGNKLIGYLHKYILIWDANNGTEINKIEFPGWQVKSVSFSNDGEKILASFYNDTNWRRHIVKIYDAENNIELGTFFEGNGYITNTFFTFDDELLIIPYFTTRPQVIIINSINNELIKIINHGHNFPNSLFPIAISHTQRIIVCTINGFDIEVYKIE